LRLPLRPFKPVETGCAHPPTDADRLAAAANLRPGPPPSEVSLYRFLDPLAPSVAARLAAQPIELPLILDRTRRLLAAGAALLVESAGGALTPYGPGLTSASLVERIASDFGFDVLLISANRLGTISQTALALDHLSRIGCRVAGVVLVDVSADPSPDQPHNAAEIHALTPVPILGTLHHCPGSDPDHLADALATDVDLSPLLGGALSR
jgi:dethiobiotin synthase